VCSVMPSLCAISLFGKGKDARLLAQFCRLFSRMEGIDLGLVLVRGTEEGDGRLFNRWE